MNRSAYAVSRNWHRGLYSLGSIILTSAGILGPIILDGTEHWNSVLQTSGVMAWAVSETFVLVMFVTSLDDFIWERSHTQSWQRELHHLIRHKIHRWFRGVSQ